LREIALLVEPVVIAVSEMVKEFARVGHFGGEMDERVADALGKTSYYSGYVVRYVSDHVENVGQATVTVLRLWVSDLRGTLSYTLDTRVHFRVGHWLGPRIYSLHVSLV
jgi:hypothetical protein